MKVFELEGYTVTEIQMEHGRRLFRAAWNDKSEPLAEVTLSRDGCVSLVIPKRFMYSMETQVLEKILSFIRVEREGIEQEYSERMKKIESAKKKPIMVGYSSYDPDSVKRLADKYGSTNIWYTERNGDGMACVMPEDATEKDLPSHACEYAVIEWIRPDKEFGSGVAPL